MPVTPDMALTLTLRSVDSGAALLTRSVGWGSLRPGLCDVPYACAIETGDEMLSLEVAAENAAAFEGTRVEMFTLHCVRRTKTNVPACHMESGPACSCSEWRWNFLASRPSVTTTSPSGLPP